MSARDTEKTALSTDDRTAPDAEGSRSGADAAQRMPPGIFVGHVLFDKYLVEHELGAGGMGVVLAVRHIALDEVFALKVLLPGAAGGSEALDRFLQEAKVMARLRSEHTVRVFDAGRMDANRPYMIMEYLRGTDLRKVLAERGPLRIDEAVGHVLEACEGIGAAHAQGIIHRDIKPSNLFLAERPGGEPCIKVIDFGISKTLAPEAVHLTASNVALGSPLYMSPEQMTRSRHVGMAADVWALGCVLYELVTGRTPFHAESVAAVIGHVLTQEPLPPSSLRPEVPPWLDAAILRCLRKAPENRYSTVDELALVLREGERGLEVPTSGAEVPGDTEEQVVAHTLRSERPGAPSQRETGGGGGTTVRVRAMSRPPKDTGGSSHDLDVQPLPAIKGENRVCSVLAVDLSSAAALSAVLDPEEMKEILDDCIQEIANQIASLGGTAERLGMDHVTGVFGARAATVVDAERAVHAALLVHTAIGKIRLPRAVRAQRLTARIGIATGRVFVETSVSGGATVVGEALADALALRQAAPPGAVAIDRATCRRSLARFSLEPLPPVVAPGRAEEIAAFKVLGPMPFRFGPRQELFFGLDTRLIGRDAEKRRLLEVFDEVVRDRCARLVTVVGAPGAGSTRLLSELFSAIATSAGSTLVASAEGSAFEQQRSYGVAALLLRNRFGIREAESPQRILHLLSRGLRFLRIKTGRRLSLDLELASSSDAEDLLGSGPNNAEGPSSSRDLGEALIELAGILDAGTSPSAGDPALRPDEDGALKKLRVTAAAAKLARFAAGRTPLVILCDDAHFVDDATLELLDQLVVRLTDRPLLIVCAAHPELYERRPHWGEGSPAHRRIDLGPLERRHVEGILRDRLRRVPDLSPTFVQKLAERADSNPLILDEMMHLCVSAGVIEAEEGSGEQRVHEDRLGELALPTTIRGFVQARLDRLDPVAREVLARAAVVGRTFWDGAVDALLAEQGRKCESIIASLRDRQLVRTRDASLFPGERERIFSEAAIQEVAYDMLPAKVRRPMHRRVARWLEKRAPGSAEAALIALHVDRAGDLLRAAEQYARAAEHAISLGQNEEARRFLVRTRELHDEIDVEAAESPGTTAVGWLDRLQVHLALGDVLRRLGRLDEAEKAYLGAKAHIPAGAPEGPRWRVRADFRLALLLKVRGDMEGALGLLERAVVAARSAGIPEETPVIYAQLVFLLRRHRRHQASWEAALAGLRACRTIARDDPRRPESIARALLGIAATLYQKKRFIAAERMYMGAVRVAERTSDPDLLGRALNGAGVVRAALGKHRRARATYLQSLRVKERAGDLHQIAIAYSNVAELEIQMNEPSAAYAHACKGAEIAERIRAGSDLAEMYRIVAEAAIGVGKHEEAVARCVRALEIGEVTSRVYLDEVVRTLMRAVAAVPAGSPGAEHAEAGRAALRRWLVEGEASMEIRGEIERFLVSGG